MACNTNVLLPHFFGFAFEPHVQVIGDKNIYKGGHVFQKGGIFLLFPKIVTMHFLVLIFPSWEGKHKQEYF